VLAAEASGDAVPVIVFKGSQACVEQLSLGDYDDVEARRDLVATEDFSNQSFSSISLDRSPELSGCGNSESAYG
jgi:hypothetical protein